MEWLETRSCIAWAYWCTEALSLVMAATLDELAKLQIKENL